MTDRELKKKLKEFHPKVWHPLDRKRYLEEWRGSKVAGVIKELFRDIKYSYQRIWKGYCEYDLFSIYDWFLEIIRPMLFEFKVTRHGSPDHENSTSQAIFLDQAEKEQDIHNNWDVVLDRMIFLFGEAEESTCSKINPYAEKYMEAYNDVWERTKDQMDKSDGHIMHFPGEYPKYKELSEKYWEKEKELSKYRMKCKEEAMALFSKWFYDLWD